MGPSGFEPESPAPKAGMLNQATPWPLQPSNKNINLFKKLITEKINYRINCNCQKAMPCSTIYFIITFLIVSFLFFYYFFSLDFSFVSDADVELAELVELAAVASFAFLSSLTNFS